MAFLLFISNISNLLFFELVRKSDKGTTTSRVTFYSPIAGRNIATGRFDFDKKIPSATAFVYT